MSWSTKTLGSAGLAQLALLWFLLCLSTRAQTQGQSASTIIRFITYQSGRADDFGLRTGVVSCGLAIRASEDDRRAANSLVALGTSALPDVEKALASLEKDGGESPFYFNGSWVLAAYAVIRGPAAYQRLDRLFENPALAAGYPLGSFMATAFHLTSYIDSSQTVRRKALIDCGYSEPRDALDRLTLAWEKNDRAAIETSLGPAGRAALESLLKRQTWQQFRAGLWHERRARRVAAGYRLETNGAWAQPNLTLDESVARARMAVNSSTIPANPQIEAQFTDKRGRECGRQRVTFYTSYESGATLTYLVNNPDISDLLRLISSCAGQGN